MKKIFSVLVITLVAVAPALAGTTVVGEAVAGKNASVGSQSVIPGYTIFSGDRLKVGEGSAIVSLGRGSRMVFGQNTAAAFERQADQVTAQLSGGSVSVYHPVEDATGVRLKVGNLSIAAAPGFKTLGEVAMAGGSVVVTTNEGLLRIEGSGQTLDVPKGKTVRFEARTRRAPQTAGGAQRYGSDKDLLFDIIAAGAAAAALGWVIETHSDVHEAITAANQADADAKQADADAKAALAAAQQANQNAIDVGCTLNLLFPNAPPASQFVPVGGTCPTT
ncbi:MAG TPA: hypothetical protein VKU44_08180 [Terriglobia bacterium]|nr:hypothetical protein [Terriglobia bacterium]